MIFKKFWHIVSKFWHIRHKKPCDKLELTKKANKKSCSLSTVAKPLRGLQGTDIPSNRKNSTYNLPRIISIFW